MKRNRLIGVASQSMARMISLLALGLSSMIMYGQDYITIKGQVTDLETGEPLIGVSISVKEAFVGTSTDQQGHFELKTKIKPPMTLVANFLGYDEKEIKVTEVNQEINIVLSGSILLTDIVVNARRRQEVAQEVPVPIAVIGALQIEQTNSFNVNRVKELVPSVQLYSSNPRNTTLNIRGIGSTFGLTNDGIDPGVGFYVDGVYYARPAATALDFMDIDRIEVLRGPQGTLFGKNTTAGAFNITTRAPSFTKGGTIEISAGNYAYLQGKGSITGALIKDKLAGRLAISLTTRKGTLYNIATDTYVNDLNNLGVKGQLLYTPTEKINITFSGDFTTQNPVGYAQVYAGNVKTLRKDFRQFTNIIADLNYTLPSENPFDRIIDHDKPWKSGNDIGGASINLDAKIGRGTLTSTTAFRYWNWDPSNDRDFTGLEVLKRSEGTSIHYQYSQELRYAGDFNEHMSGVIGLFALAQDLRSNPVQIEEAGEYQWRFSQNTTDPLWETPGLLDGYGIKTKNRLQSFTGALFGQLDWNLFSGLHVLPGLRLNYDEKKAEYDRKTYGGLQTTDPALIALQKQVYTDQAFNTSVHELTPSGQITVSYQVAKKYNAYAIYAISYKPIGVNLGGLPTIPAGEPGAGQPIIALAEIDPEREYHYELGIKTNPSPNLTLNVTGYYTDIRDYQTNVQSPQLGVNRGYLANAEHVRVTGAELDASIKLNDHLSFTGSLAYTDGKYVEFKNAPLPLEETGLTVDGKQVAFKDISGGDLPGISKYAFSFGGEWDSGTMRILGKEGKLFVAMDAYLRSGFSSSPSPSKYLNIDGYGIVNARLGFKSPVGFTVYFWMRNLTDSQYFEQLLVAGGNAGQYAAVLGDPLTYGGTVRYAF